VFLPQILILFFFVAVLEDCGYMARAAYLMDRLMTRAGLSGKSFIPLLSSFACAIPGIMATRVIESRRDRLTTILIAPLMSCSARLPVYAVLIAAFIPVREYAWGLVSLQALVMMSMYLLGMVAAAIVALILKRTLLRGPTPPFVLELPSYKWPSLGTVFHRMFERGWSFVRQAGTLIVAVSIVVWAALYYPRNPELIEGPYAAERARLESQLARLPDGGQQSRQIAEQLADIDAQIAGEYRRQSLLGLAGHWIEPVVKPLGWDWRIGCAAIASFPAREVVIATLGIIYNLGEDVDLESDDGSTRLQTALRQARWAGTDRPVFNVPVALSIMVFFALCAQCASTLVVIKRETNSWRWPLFTFGYMTVLAYVGALLTYQIGRLWL
jgi:ferrous iron transport protein B